MLWTRPFFADEKPPQEKAVFTAFESQFNIGSCTPAVQVVHFTGPQSWSEAYTTVIWPIIKAEGPVGINVLNFSRLVSRDLMGDKDKLEKVKEYILSLPKEYTFIWQNCKFFTCYCEISRANMHFF